MKPFTWGDYFGVTGILAFLGAVMVWCLTHGPPAEPDPEEVGRWENEGGAAPPEEDTERQRRRARRHRMREMIEDYCDLGEGD